MSKTIFRIQDSKGRGPFKPGFTQTWFQERPDTELAALLPFFIEFGPIHKKSIYGMHMGCGCTSLKQLKRWFLKAEYDTLLKHGYRAVKFEAGRILAESDIQCVFENSQPLSEGVEFFDLYLD